MNALRNLAALAFCFLISPFSQAFCVDPKFPKGISTQVINLPTKIDPPYFYLRSNSRDLAIIISPAKLQRFVKSLPTNNPREAEDLVYISNIINGLLPLSSSTDLFGLTLTDQFQRGWTDAWASQLVQSGNAAVYDVLNHWFLKTVTVIRENNDMASSYKIVTDENGELLSGLTCIVD